MTEVFARSVADAAALCRADPGDSATIPSWRRVFEEVPEMEAEWRRLDGKLQALAEICATWGAALSVDTWQPEVMRRALECGATVS